MSLFSFLRKNKQASPSDNGGFHSRAEEESKVVRTRRKRGSSKQDERNSDPVDPVLPEKKRARRRLIGAVALVLAAIIGLPMIFDSEPKPLGDDVAIQIPSKDKSPPPSISRPVGTTPPVKIAAANTLDPKEEIIDPLAVPEDSNAKNSSNDAADAKVTPVHTKPAADDKAATVKLSTVPQPEAKAESKVKPNHSSKPTPKAESTADTKLHEKQDDSARAMALLEGKAAPKAADKKPGKFVIQVAALATKEKIDELQTKLKDAGIRSFTQKVATGTGDRTRIRVGPFGSKDEADKMRAKIVKLGLNGTLVPLDS